MNENLKISVSEEGHHSIIAQRDFRGSDITLASVLQEDLITPDTIIRRSVFAEQFSLITVETEDGCVHYRRSGKGESLKVSAFELMVLFLIFESKTQTSVWSEYLAILSTKQAYFDPELLDGTALYRAAVRRSEQVSDLTSKLQGLGFDVDLAEVRWANGIIKSRSFPWSFPHKTSGCFEVEGDLQLLQGVVVLVPILDYFNHRAGTQITWKSTDKSLSFIQDEVDYCQGEEVFNNYGAKSNAELVLGYGFSAPFEGLQQLIDTVDFVYRDGQLFQLCFDGNGLDELLEAVSYSVQSNNELEVYSQVHMLLDSRLDQDLTKLENISEEHMAYNYLVGQIHIVRVHMQLIEHYWNVTVQEYQLQDGLPKAEGTIYKQGSVICQISQFTQVILAEQEDYTEELLDMLRQAKQSGELEQLMPVNWNQSDLVDRIIGRSEDKFILLTDDFIYAIPRNDRYGNCSLVLRDDDGKATLSLIALQDVARNQLQLADQVPLVIPLILGDEEADWQQLQREAIY